MSGLEQENLNLGEIVYEYIKDMILKKQLVCGEKIPEEKIARKLGTSRTPIRDALKKLSVEGLINLYPKRYAEVVSFNEKIIEDLGILRIELDTLAAQLAIQNGSNADFYRLKDLADLCCQAAREGDVFNRIKYDCDFHLFLTQLGGNPVLLKFQKELYLKVHLLQAITYDRETDSMKNIEHHQLIVDRLFERNIEEVVKCVQQHLLEFYKININKIITTTYLLR